MRIPKQVKVGPYTYKVRFKMGALGVGLYEFLSENGLLAGDE